MTATRGAYRKTLLADRRPREARQQRQARRFASHDEIARGLEAPAAGEYDFDAHVAAECTRSPEWDGRAVGSPVHGAHESCSFR
jgi:hypothetical protein